MKYRGSCHCKQVTFVFDTEAEISSGMTCNCSRCHIIGVVWHFMPKKDLTILTGENNLTTYLFNKEVLEHMFCKTCGVETFAFGKKDEEITAAVNLRTVKDLDLETLDIHKFDGKDL